IGRHIEEDERSIRFRNRGNHNVLAIPTQRLRMSLLRADEWVKRTYDVYCEVWQLQGNLLSPEFLRAVCANGIRTLITARINSVIGELKLEAVRTNWYPNAWLNAATAEFR